MAHKKARDFRGKSLINKDVSLNRWGWFVGPMRYEAFVGSMMDNGWLITSILMNGSVLDILLSGNMLEG